MKAHKDTNHLAPAASPRDVQTVERAPVRPEPESDLLKALKIAWRALGKIDESSRHHDHGVTYLGDVAQQARREMTDVLWDRLQ